MGGRPSAKRTQCGSLSRTCHCLAGAPRAIERAIGELLADAASAIAQALREFQNGGLRTETKMHGVS
jgi:hypothetical protein